MKETLAFHITALYREFLVYTTRELKALGLRFGQLPLIIYVGKYPGCTQAQLTRDLHLDWGYSQRSITKLVDSGFMQKTCGQQKSGHCLTLTEQGRQAFSVSHSVFSAWDQEKTAGLSAQEQETLLRLLDKLTAERTVCR